MNYNLRVYMGNQIIDIALNSDIKLVTIGSSESDTFKVPYSDVIASQLVFEYINNQWYCEDRAKNEKKPLNDGDVFILSMTNRVAVFVYTEILLKQEISIKNQGKITIGRSADSMFHLPDRSVGNNHAVVIVDDVGATIKDLNSLNGTFLNNTKISEKTLKDGDIISIGKYNILFASNTLKLCDADAIKPKKAEIPYPVFSLSPRLRHQMPSEIIEIQAPPNIGNMPTVNWLSFLPMLATRSPYAAVFPLSSALSTFMQKKKYKKSKALRQEKYENYLADVKAKIDKNREDQFLSLEESNHETIKCYDIATRRERTLWERTPQDDDFMRVRVGRGNIETSFKIKFPDNILKMYSDELEDQGEDLGRGSQTLENAPILCDLYYDLSVGIIGNREKALSVARNMIVQVTTTHSYKDVKLITLFSKKETKEWEFTKWLPHSFSDSRERRYLANDVFNAAKIEKTIDEELKGRSAPKESELNEQSDNNPFYLFVISEPDLIEESEIENYLDGNSVGLGIGVIYVYKSLRDLPKSCNVIIDVKDGCNEIFHKSDIGTKQKFEIDSFSLDKANVFARSLAPVRLAEKKSVADMPTCVTFLEGYNVRKVEEIPIESNWEKADIAKSITVPLGVKANGEQFMFNMMYGNDFLKYHGPFGLVAGTNGSGKSEMMQSWILSLATKFSPQELSFIIIDYKGTGMLLPFRNLPHLAGKISNLDGNVKRNIIALNKEMKRRQAIFDKVGIVPQDIKEYHKRGFHKTYQKLPVIIIVIDEFAEIKKNLPDFVPVLESLFAVGRSLGIFAIVSTQKPSGVVTDKMYANSKFRWCCRVSSTADSKEMLHHPDAAKINNAGRAYVQVGEDDIYERVQSYWSGAPYMPDKADKSVQNIPVSLVDITGNRVQYEVEQKNTGETQVKEIDAVVDYIKKVADEKGIAKSPKVWQEKLANRIYLDDVLTGNNKDGFVLEVGMVDNPYEQAQYPLEVNFSNDGHCLVYGAPGTGKTTFLQTSIMSAVKSYSPEDVHIYAMDFGSWSLNLFSKVPHVGGVANDNDSEKIDKLVNMLKKELDERKKSFAMNGIINIKSYEQTTGQKLPYILLVIDNFNAVFSLYPNLDDFFIKLSREGASYGIYILATTGASTGISFKISSNIKNNIALQLKDKSDYVGVVGKTDGLEPDNHFGRGLIKGNPFALEFQTALPAYGNDDNEVLENIKIETSKIENEAGDYQAKQIPIMPDVIQYGSVHGHGLILGLTTETIDPVEIDIENSNHCIVVSGEKKSGRSNIFNVIIRQFRDKLDARIVLFDNGSGSLESLSNIAEQYLTTAEEFDMVMERIASELNHRKDIDNLDDETPIVIGIDGYKTMYEAIDDKTASRLSALVRLGKGLKVYLVVAEEAAVIGTLCSIEQTMNTLVSDGTGVLVGGTFKNHTGFKSTLDYTEANAMLGEFEAYIVSHNEATRFKTMYEF